MSSGTAICVQSPVCKNSRNFMWRFLSPARAMSCKIRGQSSKLIKASLKLLGTGPLYLSFVSEKKPKRICRICLNFSVVSCDRMNKVRKTMHFHFWFRCSIADVFAFLFFSSWNMLLYPKISTRTTMTNCIWVDGTLGLKAMVEFLFNIEVIAGERKCTEAQFLSQ